MYAALRLNLLPLNPSQLFEWNSATTGGSCELLWARCCFSAHRIRLTVCSSLSPSLSHKPASNKITSVNPPRSPRLPHTYAATTSTHVSFFFSTLLPLFHPHRFHFFSHSPPVSHTVDGKQGTKHVDSECFSTLGSQDEVTITTCTMACGSMKCYWGRGQKATNQEVVTMKAHLT